MAALDIRKLDEAVKRRIQVRAARHGRSMEAEVRGFCRGRPRARRFRRAVQALLDQFGTLGGADLQLPERNEPARAADFS